MCMTNPQIVSGQTCPMCLKPTLSLTEFDKEIPYFGTTYFFSMECSNCDYYKADLEAANQYDPCKYTFITDGKEEDLKVRVVKSASATIKIPTLKMSVAPGPTSNGYVSNVEGIINRFQKMLEKVRDQSDDKTDRKSVKRQLKKILDFKSGRQEIKIVLEDPTGNSMIISPDAKKEKLRVKKTK